MIRIEQEIIDSRGIFLGISFRLAQVLMMPNPDKRAIASAHEVMRILRHRLHISLQIRPLEILQLIYARQR